MVCPMFGYIYMTVLDLNKKSFICKCLVLLLGVCSLHLHVSRPSAIARARPPPCRFNRIQIFPSIVVPSLRCEKAQYKIGKISRVPSRPEVPPLLQCTSSIGTLLPSLGGREAGLCAPLSVDMSRNANIAALLRPLR